MLKTEDRANVYLKYEGPFNIQIISSIAKYLSELTIAKHSVRKKLYRVFIELTQNIALYSFERTLLLQTHSIGRGKVYIIDNEDEFKCITINRIQKEHASILLTNCAEINATPVTILRAKKRELYKMSTFQDTGAHVGLIMIFIDSENPLDFEIIEKDNDEVYFKIAATISKKHTI